MSRIMRAILAVAALGPAAWACGAGGDDTDGPRPVTVATMSSAIDPS